MTIPGRLREWIINHDDKTAFTVLYIGLSLALSIVFGLFWLVLIVFCHWILEMISQSFKSTNFLLAFGNSLWEIKLDLALVFMALWLAVYLDFIFGIAGLGVAARSAAQITNQTIRTSSRMASTTGNIAKTTVRFAGWQRIIRSTLLSVDDVLQSVRGIFKAKSKTGKITKTQDQEFDQIAGNQKKIKESLWAGKWTLGDKASVLILIIFICLIMTAPWIIDKSFNEVTNIILEELTP